MTNGKGKLDCHRHKGNEELGNHGNGFIVLFRESTTPDVQKIDRSFRFDVTSIKKLEIKNQHYNFNA